MMGFVVRAKSVEHESVISHVSKFNRLWMESQKLQRKLE
jgi:hypothetical protein